MIYKNLATERRLEKDDSATRLPDGWVIWFLAGT